MIKELYIECYIACLIGNLIHLLLAYYDRHKDMKALNEKMSLIDFVKIERAAVMANFAASMGLVYVADEWLDNPYIMGKIKTFFVVVGVTGSYFVLKLVGMSKRIVRQQADVKSNIADYGTPEKPKE